MKVTDLKANEGIHCPTQEIFNQIIALNPKNDVEPENWLKWKERTVYTSFERNGNGAYGSFESAKANHETVYPHTDFLQPKYPERGELVYVWDGDRKPENPTKRIFLTYIEGAFRPIVTVSSNFESRFKKGLTVETCSWKHFERIPKKVINKAEALELLKEQGIEDIVD